MSEEKIREVTAAYFAATRAMDIEAWLATMAEDIVSHDPVGAPPHVGKDAMSQFFQGIVGAFETVGLTDDEVYVAGNESAIKWTGRGVGKNGRSVEFQGIDIFVFNEEGKIREVRAYWNPAAMMAELQG